MAKKYLEIQESKKLSIWELEGSISDVSHFLHELANECGNDAYIDISQYFDGEVEVEVSWTRLETDVERDKRLAKAKKVRKARKEEKKGLENCERAELARLQEKYS